MITTKTGDRGRTTCGNKRVDKDNLLVELIGTIDEFQSVLELVDADEKIISDMGKIMGILAFNEKFLNSNFQISINKMEKEIKSANLSLDKFVVFKTKKAKEFNWARTVCRRAERRLVSWGKQSEVEEGIFRYLNRLSDYLFLKAVKNN